MRKIPALILAALLCFCLSACGKTVHIDFPFELSDVKTVEMFRYTVPANAEKKALTNAEDIRDIYELLESISLKDKAAEPTAGSSVIYFQFHLADNTSYVVAYSELSVKSGRIRTEDMETAYFTSANIAASWDNYDYEAVAVNESDLPSYQQTSGF